MHLRYCYINFKVFFKHDPHEKAVLIWKREINLLLNKKKKIHLEIHGTWVQSLVMELGFHMPQGS